MWEKIKLKLRGWKTLIWNGFVVGIAPLVLFALDQLQFLDFNQYLTPEYVFIVTVGVKAVDMWLRVITTGPIGSKGDEAPAPDVKAGD